MLYKFKRHKPRKGFAVDRIFKGLSTNKFSKEGRHLFTTHKYLAPYFDDDRFCNMLVQWNEQVMGKLKSTKATRLFMSNPSFIPLISQKDIISKADYYKLDTSVEYNCISCGTDITCEWGERSVKNFLCSKCISENFIDSKGDFVNSKSSREIYSDKFSKNILDFFKLEQKKEKQIMLKLLKRSAFLHASLNDKSKVHKIYGMYTKIKNSLPTQ